MTSPYNTFGDLYDQHFNQVYAYFSVCFGKEPAEDLSQQTFLKLWDHLTRPDFTRPEDWKAWIFTVAVNLKNDYLRQKYRRGETLAYDELQDATQTETDEELLKSIAVNRALAALELEEKELLLLKNSGFTSAEIGQMLGISDSAVRSRYSTAKKHFKQRLQEGGIL